MLGDQCYRLRPTFEALAEAEQKTGSLIALVERAGSGQILLSDIAALLHACAKAGGHDVTYRAFAEDILRVGVGTVAEPLQQLLTIIMSGSAAED